MTDTRPPVPPVEGNIAVLRNGVILGPIIKHGYCFVVWSSDISWFPDGVSEDGSESDIIATISPEDMQAVVSGELARLRAEASQLQGQVAWLRSAIDTVVGPKP